MTSRPAKSVRGGAGLLRPLWLGPGPLAVVDGRQLGLREHPGTSAAEPVRRGAGTEVAAEAPARQCPPGSDAVPALVRRTSRVTPVSARVSK